MKYTIKNRQLTVTVDSIGAELVSVKKREEEYIRRRRDSELWLSHAPILFPVCGRLNGGVYLYDGREYKMPLHGFAKDSDFEVRFCGNDRVLLSLSADEKSKELFPFDFEFTVEYRLSADAVDVKTVIKNKGDKVMPATVGFHPGFAIANDADLLSDCRIDFVEDCSPDKLLLSSGGFNTGRKTAFWLKDGHLLNVSDDLIGDCGLFLSNTSGCIRLESPVGKKRVEIDCHGIPYVGMWREKNAGYLCIEPWCGLPSFESDRDDLETKNDMFRIQPMTEKEIGIRMKFF